MTRPVLGHQMPAVTNVGKDSAELKREDAGRHHEEVRGVRGVRRMARPPSAPWVRQNAHRRGMKMTDRMQKRILSGMPARRKSVYRYPPGL